MRSFGWILQNQNLAIKILMFLSPPKKHAKTGRALLHIESELRSWRQFKSGARSSWFELQIESEGFRLHTSVQPVEPQTRVKLGRSAFFLPDFQFRFKSVRLQPNVPQIYVCYTRSFDSGVSHGPSMDAGVLRAYSFRSTIIIHPPNDARTP